MAKPIRIEIEITPDSTIKDKIQKLDYCWVARTDRGKNDTVYCPYLYPIQKEDSKKKVQYIEIPDIYANLNEVHFKITVYGWLSEEKSTTEDGYFMNCGTALFKLYVPSKKEDSKSFAYDNTVEYNCIYLNTPKIETAEWSSGEAEIRTKITVFAKIPYVSTGTYHVYNDISRDLIRMYEEHIQRLLRNNSTLIPHCTSTNTKMYGQVKDTKSFKNLNCIGFIRTSQMEYEWPFATTGGFGIHQISMGKPTFGMINKLVEHACAMCGFHYDNYDKCENTQIKQNVLEAIVTLTVGAAGYVHGYSEETVDDTSTVWSAMGSNKDCEDFATAGAGLVYAIQNYKNDYNEDSDQKIENGSTLNQMTREVITYIQSEVKEARVASGWVDIGIADPTKKVNNKEWQGHVWCILFLKSENTKNMLFVECTTPLLPHSEEPNNKRRISELYADVFNLLPNSALPEGLGYGPAGLQPLQRYKELSFTHSDNNSYAYYYNDETRNVGCCVSDFIEEFKIDGSNSNSNNKIIEMDCWKKIIESKQMDVVQNNINKMKQLMYNPDFKHESDIIKSIDLHTRQPSENFNNNNDGQRERTTPPKYCNRFIPMSNLNRYASLHLRNSDTILYLDNILPTAWGVYIGTDNECVITTTSTLIDYTN